MLGRALQRDVKRETQHSRQPCREVRHEFRATARRDGRDPRRRRSRAPLSHQLCAGVHQLVREAFVAVFPVPHRIAPAGISPQAQRSSGFCLKGFANLEALPRFGRSAGWPSFARLLIGRLARRRNAAASRISRGIDGLWQWREPRLRHGPGVAVQGLDQKLHVPRCQYPRTPASVPALSAAMPSAARPVPEGSAQLSGDQLPFLAVGRNGDWRGGLKR